MREEPELIIRSVGACAPYNLDLVSCQWPNKRVLVSFRYRASGKKSYTGDNINIT